MLQPPHLKAIIPVYATDDRYIDDVRYLGGCMVASELAQYAVSQIGMNALPPRPEYAGSDWAGQWQARLEQTPPWLIEWLRHPADGPYWRSGSLAPDHGRMLNQIIARCLTPALKDKRRKRLTTLHKLQMAGAC